MSRGHPGWSRVRWNIAAAAALLLLAACGFLLGTQAVSLAQSKGAAPGAQTAGGGAKIWTPHAIGPAAEMRYVHTQGNLQAPTNFRVLNAPLVNGVYEAQARSFDLAWELPANATGLEIYYYELVQGISCPNLTTCQRFQAVDYPGLRATSVPVFHASAGRYVYEIHSTDGTNTSDAAELTVDVPDMDGIPAVSVRFGSATYSANEGNSVDVEVRLSADPERTVRILLSTDNLGGATNADYSGVPAEVTFASGETLKTFTVSVTQDDIDDDGESVRILFRLRPALVAAGSPRETAVSLVDDDGVTPPPPTPTRSSGGGGGLGAATVAPRFGDGFRTTRTVPLNAGPGDAVGDPVQASHQDNLEVAYSLSGADASLFTVDEDTGQLRVREGAEIAEGQDYTVNMTATDTAGFGAIIIVAIEVVEATHHRYDVNGNGTIERDEVLKAVADYFGGLISREEVLEVVKLYFGS